MAEGFDFNAPPKERTALHLTRVGGAALLFLLVVITHSWMGGLEFQLDDFEQVYEALRTESPAVLLGQDRPEQIVLRGHPTMVRFFRPVLHASLVLDGMIFGANARAFHLSSVLWHGIAVVLLYLVLRSMLAWRSPQLAFSAALVFAIHPGKNGAVSWIAARGDLLMTVFFLAALASLVAYRRHAKTIAAVFVFVFLILALGAKEGAVTAPLVLFVIDLALVRRLGRPTPIPRALRFAIAYAALAPIYLVARAFAFGGSADFYAGEHRTWTFEILGRMIGDFAPVLAQLSTGSFQFDSGSIGARIMSGASSALFIGLIVWASRRPILRTQAIVGLLLAYTFAVLPALRFLSEASGFDASRVFYFPAVFTSILIALPLQGFTSRVRLVRTATLVYAIIFGLAIALGGIMHARAQWSAAELIRRVRTDLSAVARTTPRKDVWYAILGLPNDVDRAPTFGTFLTYAFLSPLADPPIIAKNVIDEDVFLGTEELYRAPAPIRILRWNARDERLDPETAILPEPSGKTWTVEIPDPKTPVRFDPPIRPRDVRTLTFAFPAPLGDFDATFRFVDENDDHTDLKVHYEARLGTQSILSLPVAERKDWVLRGFITRLEIIDVKGSLPTPFSMRTADTLPEVTLLTPSEDEKISATAAEPAFRFKTTIPASVFRWTVYAGATKVTWTLPRSALDVVDGDVLAFRVGMKGEGPGEVPRFWADLTSAGNILDRRGVTDMPLTWKIEAFIGTLDFAAAKSASRTAKITR